MVLKVHGTYRSSWARLVVAILYEKEVPFEFIVVNMPKREHKSPEYLTKQPYGQVPYIDDDGFILYETRAICYYIASKYSDQGTPLLPVGLEANALYQQAVFVELSHFDQHFNEATKELYKTYRGLTPDQVIVDKHIADLSVKLEVYDQILSKRKYLLGDEISLVDFYHIPGGYTFTKAGSKVMESKPNVARWFKDITSRASWKATDHPGAV